MDDFPVGRRTPFSGLQLEGGRRGHYLMMMTIDCKLAVF